MNNGLIKVICVTSALALVVAFGSPQVGKRKGTTGGGTSTTGGGGGGGGTTTGGSTGGGTRPTTGGGSTGGGPGRRQDPPPARTTTGGGGGGGTTTTTGGSGSSGGTGGRRQDPPTTTGGGGGFPPITTTGGGFGRIDRNRDTGRVIIGGGTQGGIGRRGDSRSGDVRYGTINNQVQRQGQGGRIRIDRPGGIINQGMQRRVNDQERVGLVYNGWRVGYCHYDNRWQDDFYRYPYYLFNPWQSNRYVTSPWYYYPSCPPYLNSTRVIIINAGWPSYNWSGQNYSWSQPDRNDRYQRYGDFDYAVEDLVSSFERRDYRAIERLVPRSGNVHMYFDGRYGYSLDSRDFYDLFVDGIENVRTSRYEILNVQHDGRSTARVLAKHEFTDPWGQRNFTYHNYFLEQDRRDWIIREFGTSSQRPW